MTYDVVAVGCGPFNLGLAALASGVDGLDLAVFDDRPEFTWHRGLMFGDAMLQVPFLADLVSLVEPAHPLSFLAWLRDTDRLYQFYVREAFHPSRREYEAYLRWVAAQLDTVRFGHQVRSVTWDGATFQLTVAHGNDTRTITAHHVVLGIGTEPSMPPALTGVDAVHTADYLYRRDDLLAADHVTVVGSGQSGAECALDLLRAGAPRVSWLTRTPSFAPLDYSKLVLEMTTPSYVDYFHGLPEPARDRLVREQWRHYKGISGETLDAIHDALYRRDLDGTAPAELRCGVAVEAARRDGPDIELTLRHADTGHTFTHHTAAVVAATGYRQREPAFLGDLADLLHRDDAGRFRIERDHSVAADEPLRGRVFVANADLHSHGVAAPDLGIGAVRNATILNAVTGRECFRLPKTTAYTTFTAPGA